MTSLVTVVVPVLNADRTLDACLASVRAQTYPRIEIVVVDGRSSDRSAQIAGRHADRVISMAPGVCAQRNAGWRAGTGEIVVFIDADMVLESRVIADTVAALADDPAAGGVVIPEHAFGQGFLASCRVLEKRMYVGDSSVEAARVFPRHVLEEVDGYDEELARAFEDWDLQDRVIAAGHGLTRVRSYIWHDEGKVGLRRQFRKKRGYGGALPCYRTRGEHAPVRRMTRPQLLTKLPVARYPIRSAGLLLLKSVEGAGLISGALTARRIGR